MHSDPELAYVLAGEVPSDGRAVAVVNMQPDSDSPTHSDSLSGSRAFAVWPKFCTAHVKVQPGKEQRIRHAQ